MRISSGILKMQGNRVNRVLLAFSHIEHVKQHAEKEAQKSAKSVVRDACIANDTLMRTFYTPLSSWLALLKSPLQELLLF